MLDSSFPVAQTYVVNGVRLNVRSAGAGEPALVLLHYYGGSSRTWHLVMQRLAGENRCIAPDLRGWGDSEAPASGYAVEDMAEDMAQLVGAMGVKRYVLAGHSMGGKVAQALASRYPAGLESLALVAPSPPTPEPMSDGDRARLAAGWADPQAARETLRRITALPLPIAEWDMAVEDAARCSQAAWLAWLNEGSREDIAARVSQINVPTEVLAGGADPVMRTAMLEREVVGRIAGARLTIAPGTGHLSPLEAPDAVADFLRQVQRR